MSFNFVSIQDFIKAFKEKQYHQVIKNGEEKIIEFSFKEKDKLFNIIGLSFFELKQYSKSIHYFLKSIELNPNSFEFFSNLASAYLKNGEFNKAEDSLKKSIKLNYKNLNSHLLLSKIYLANKNNDKAVNYLQSLEMHKDNVQLIFEIGRIYLEIRNYQESLNWFLKAKKMNPNSPSIYNNLGVCYDNLNDKQNSLSSFKSALKLDPNYIHSIINIANLHRSLGEFDVAKTYYELALSKNLNLQDIHRQIGGITKYVNEEKDTHIKSMLKLDALIKKDEDKIELLFALSKAYEDLKKYKVSGEYLVRANQSKSNVIQYNLKHNLDQFEVIKQIFTEKKFIKSKIKHVKTPIFIVGMPRSGTTLLEQIISSHSKVFSGGELYFFQKQIKQFFPDSDNKLFKKSVLNDLNNFVEKIGEGYIKDLSHLTDKNIITDKLPFNFLFIGFIKLALPDAKILHIFRDPRDNCFSIYKNYFPYEEIGFAYNQIELAKYYNAYSEMMKFWKNAYPDILEISYEDLVTFQEKETKKVIKYCKLDWEENCLDFYKNKAPVRTLSTSQVRQKIYKTSVQSWKNYEFYLKDLILNLKC